MVSASFLLSLLAAPALLSTAVLAVPQDDGAGNSTDVPTVADLEKVKMVFPALEPAAQPVAGGDNSTLLVAAPQLAEIVKSAPTLPNALTKRELEKRERCSPNLKPAALWQVWDYYAYNFCNHYFPDKKIAYYVKEGKCVSGKVPRHGKFIPATLEYKYCARSCGQHTSFVAITNAVCHAQLKKIIQHAITSWTCPGYKHGRRPGWVSGGDNKDQPRDAADWIIKAL